MQNRSAVIAAATVLALISAANADAITGTITADNHYSLYTSTGSVFNYHGGNELGTGGNPGQYNWSMAEPHQFAAGEYLYIAAWSDDSVAQGVLASFTIPGMGVVLSGDARWQVYATNLNLGDGSNHPTADDIAGHVNFADTNNLWVNIFAGGTNGIQPWGEIAGVDAAARWMWKAVDGVENPLTGGYGQAEMLVFRMAVPTPGAAALIGIAGLACTRRRRAR